MAFGGEDIVFVALVENTVGGPDELGNYPLVETRTVATGCRHRPLTFAETVEMQFDVATQPWKSTIPLRELDGSLIELILAAKPNDVIEVGGVPYQVVGGIRPHADLAGRPFKATLISTVFV